MPPNACKPTYSDARVNHVSGSGIERRVSLSRSWSRRVVTYNVCPLSSGVLHVHGSDSI